MFIKQLMTKAKSAIFMAAVVALAGTAPVAAADKHVKIGVLTCASGPSIGLLITSKEKIDCAFVPSGMDEENYSGVIRKFGLDIGATAGSVIVWGVFAAQSDYVPGSLAGEYVGVSAEQTVILGLGANLLVGGSEDSIVLQPLSVQAQAGLNLAVGVTRLVLSES